MQKLISSFIYSICLILLTLTLINSNNAFLNENIPFFKKESHKTPSDITITAKELGVSSDAATPSALHAKAYCLMDAESGQILIGHNENEKLPMASTTKIMTCIVALEHGNLNDTVTASSYAASMPDVQLNMKQGEKFLLKDLMYSLMLESHNDTAVAIAEHIGGSVEGFAKLMNDKAEELGCTDTHFVTPNGLDDDDHYTTASDLCKIACYAIQSREFIKIIQTPSYSFMNKDNTRSYSVNNKDAFLKLYEGALGIKTGFTGNAGYCFVGAAKRKNTTLISSVLACGWPPNKSFKWSDTTSLMNYGFSKYTKYSLTPDNTLPAISVKDGINKNLHIKRSSMDSFTILLTASDKIKISYDIPSQINAPVRAGDIIGYERYSLNNKLYYEIPLVADTSVKKADDKFFRKIMFNLFFMKYTY